MTLPLAAEYFVIDEYEIEIDVAENNRYEIVETIDVTFSEQRHGIFRTIPDMYNGRPVLIENIQVDSHRFQISDEVGEINIRIGDPNAYVDGKQRYVIRYDYDMGKDAYDDMDEFYFNLIGTDWPVPIGRVEFKIRMPKPFDESRINFTWGREGSTEKAPVEYGVDDTVISGVLDSRLAPYEALTIALPLPEGYYVGAVEHEEPVITYLTWAEFPADIIAVILAFVFWYLWGRDNTLTTVVEYRAPEGMLPSEIGYIVDGSVDPKDVTSLIVYMAEKGYLSIEEEGRRKLKLVKEHDVDPTEKEYVRDLFDALFDKYGSNGEVTTKELTNKFYVTMRSLQQAIRKDFTDDPERRIFEKPKWYIGLLLGLLVLGLIMKTGVRVLYPLIYDLGFTAAMAGLVSVFTSAGLFLLASAFGRQEGFRLSSFIPRVLFGIIFGIGPSVVLFFVGNMFYTVNPIYLGAGVVAAFMVALFSHLMTKRTEYGDRMVERVLGLREFIRQAEADRIEQLFKENPSYYYDVLPYAMVLGVSDVWAKHFDGLSLEPPTWYRSDYRRGFRAAAFNDSLSRQFNSLNASMSSSPSSSSSSGGSSGGGGGGGGGGSW